MVGVGTNKLWLSLPTPCDPHPLHLCDLSLTFGNDQWQLNTAAVPEQSGEWLPGCQSDISFPELLLFMVSYSENKQSVSGQKGGIRMALSEFTVWGFVRSESKDEKR